MIKNIFIKNFILIDEISLDLEEGFNVFTGETGAGKSIIINAIDIALGSKVSCDTIKQGEERAVIELTISVDDMFDKAKLSDNGIDVLSNEIIVSREILPTTTRSRVNGVLVTQDFVKELRESLIDIHTQHQNYNYIQPKTHIKLLDSFGNEEHKNLLARYLDSFSKLKEIENKLNKAISASNATEQQIDFLKFQIKEIEEANIEEVDEYEKLAAEIEILLNAEKLKEHSYSAYYALYDSEQNIVNSLCSVRTVLSKLSALDNNALEFEEEVVNSIENLKEIASSLRSYSEKQELDEERIYFVQERMDVLDKIKRKYGNSLQDVLDTYYKLSQELESISFSQDEVIRLQSEKETALSETNEIAQRLSELRYLLAENLSSLVTQELEKLELPKVQFKVNIEMQELSENGIDDVEFLISTNISEPLKPLAKVASGGEISRVMLAIKTIFANADNTNTVIFDEIDTGISGRASQAVADSISNLAKNHQILLITHQPIIAARANSHIYITKTQDEKTEIKVYNLKGENVVKAIAMLASGDINDESMNFARGLINQTVSV